MAYTLGAGDVVREPLAVQATASSAAAQPPVGRAAGCGVPAVRAAALLRGGPDCAGGAAFRPGIFPGALAHGLFTEGEKRFFQPRGDSGRRSLVPLSRP